MRPQTAMLHETQFLSPKQFAVLSGLSIATVRRYLDSDAIQSSQPAGKRHRILIPRAEVARFKSEMGATGSPAPASCQSPPPLQPTQPKAGPRPRWRRQFEHH